MKKHFILLLSVLYSSLVFAQEKKISDAIYIVFEKSENQIKKVPNYTTPLRGLDPITNYLFYFDDKHLSYFKFYHAKYRDMDAMEANVKSEVITVKKSFLRKHKKDVFDMDTFLRMGIEKSYLLFYNYRKIYIIDKSEIKRGQVTMYQVGLYSTYFPEI